LNIFPINASLFSGIKNGFYLFIYFNRYINLKTSFFCFKDGKRRISYEINGIGAGNKQPGTAIAENRTAYFGYAEYANRIRRT